MRNLALPTLLSLALLLTACGAPPRAATRTHAAAEAPRPAQARAAAQALADEAAGPPVTAPDHPLSRFPDGTTMRLSEARGSVVMLDVWATWCGPCVESLPAYDAIAKRYAPQGLKVFAVSLDEDPRQVAKFVEDTGIGLTILLDDQDQQVSRALRVRGVPTTYLIDRKGTIRAVHAGYEPADLPALTAQLEQLLAEAP